MMYLNLIAVVVLFISFLLIVMNIIVSRLRTKENERIAWKMDNMPKRDKVVTRTGGLAHDRIYDTILDEDIIMDGMEDLNDRVARERQNAFKTTLEDAKEALDNKKK